MQEAENSEIDVEDEEMFEGVIDLSFVKCIWVKSEDSKIPGMRGIIFLKNSYEFEIYPLEKYFEFCERLRSKVLLTDIYDEYETSNKYIGKGGLWIVALRLRTH